MYQFYQKTINSLPLRNKEEYIGNHCVLPLETDSGFDYLFVDDSEVTPTYNEVTEEQKEYHVDSKYVEPATTNPKRPNMESGYPNELLTEEPGENYT